MLRRLFMRGSRVLGLTALAALLGVGAAFAQTGRVAGTVRDADTGDPIAGARVVVIGTQLAATTNQNGYYAIENVPVGTHNLRANVIGYQPVTVTNTRVSAGLPTTVNFSLQQSILRIEGIVVTGVAEQTEVVKLPFTVDQVSGQDMPVPPVTAEESLRGKVAGVKVIRGEGTPGESSISVLLRGATSINTSGRSNEPLYVVDGVILGATMVDVDALDIETVEVVKGAAAAALYGSRAANGVISITTRRGRDIPEGETRISFRTDFGASNIERPIPQSSSHEYVIQNGKWLGFTPTDDTVLIDADYRARATRPISKGGDDWRPYEDVVNDSTDWDGDGTFTPHSYKLKDNEFPGRTFDNLDRFFNPGSFGTQTLRISHRSGTTNFLASFHETKETGIVEGLDGYTRRGARLNVDHQLGTQFDFSASAYYSQAESDDPQGGGANAFYALNFYPIDVDLLELDTIANCPGPNPRENCTKREIRDSLDYLIKPDFLVVEENPMYSARNSDVTNAPSRVLGNFRLRWRPVEQFNIQSEFSFDRRDNNFTRYNFKGFKTIGSGQVNKGMFIRSNSVSEAVNLSVDAVFDESFGELNTIFKARALLERDRVFSFSATAIDLAVNDVRDLDLGDQTLNDISSSQSEIRALGYFLSSQLDFGGRYIVDALVRRDGSSLFGRDERWQWYYRIGGAYRVAQESWWPFEFLDEFKLRFSQGTAGGRPRFSAQYETYNCSGGICSKGNLGNRLLKPEFVTEREAGVDMMIAGRVSAGVTYAKSEAEEQILEIPLSAPFGYSNQWRNAGTLNTNTWEGTLQASLIQRPNLGWSMNFVIDRTRQRITEFGRGAYRAGPGNAWYIRNNEILGRMYGDRWVTRCNEIYDPSSGVFFYSDATSCVGNGWDINDDGYLVPVGTGNTYQDGVLKNYYGSTIPMVSPDGADTLSLSWGLPFVAWDTTTNPSTGTLDTTNYLPIGNSIPDFNWGFGNTVRVGGLQLYVLFDAQVGGDVYNNTRQWSHREDDNWEADQRWADRAFTVPKAEGDKKPLAYNQRLYDVNAVNSTFVEDGSYVKLRELSLAYTFNRAQLEGVFGGFIKRLTFSVVGRNIKTWTDYKGYDPEVSTDNSNAGVYRYDGFEYPNYRTISGAVEIEF
ncbi:MAG: SusC/RagA family TonB-linked outer membrane protein [Gemmatimonadales bacterium]